MTNKPWWLWEGAAVRVKAKVGKIEFFYSGDGYEEGCSVMLVAPYDKDTPAYDLEINAHVDDLIPIENPAVTFAPNGATHVYIGRNSVCAYAGEHGEQDAYMYARFVWPQCPDHLKGHTWPLPGRREG